MASEPKLCKNVLEVKGLNFNLGGVQVLNNVSLTVKSGSRCLLVGANGAGKTSLLRVLGGKHMHEPGTVQVLQKSAFHDTALNLERQYVNNQWGMRTVAFAGSMVAHQADIPVSDMMKDLQAEVAPCILSPAVFFPSIHRLSFSFFTVRFFDIFFPAVDPSILILLHYHPLRHTFPCHSFRNVVRCF